jgi:dephospho-CoA kinase
MLKVGLTGGIGSGKSTVLEVFELLGVKVYRSDEESKKLIQTDPELIHKIKNAFGQDLYNQKNELDKKKLAEIVFNDSAALEKLNHLVHPAVIKDFSNWVEKQNSESYVIKESALFFEAEITHLVDRIITVYTPMQIRVQRLLERDNSTEKDVAKRIENQLPESVKMEGSDFVIFNDEENSIIEQVLSLHNELKTNIKT